jgi:hypothetical protein
LPIDVLLVSYFTNHKQHGSVFHASIFAGDYGFDLIDLLVGFDSAEAQMQSLVNSIDMIFNGDYPSYLRDLALKLILR